MGDAQDSPEARETLGWSDCQPAGDETLLLALTISCT